MTRGLVLEPGLRFVELDAALSSHGWSGGPTITFAPLVPGEPELARWTKQSASLEYTCNPAIWFRTLEAKGVRDSEWSTLTGDLPHLDEADAIAYLGEPFEERVLVGLFAVRVLGVSDAAAQVERLTGDARPLVRELASQVRAEWAARGSNL